jgi:hypothetical protein
VVETCAEAFHVADAALAHAPTSSQDYETTNPAKASLAMAKAASGSARTDAVRAGMGKLRRTLEEIVVKYMFKGTVTRWDDRIAMSKIKEVAWSEEVADEIYSTFAELSRFVEGHSHSEELATPPEAAELATMIVRVEGIVAKARAKRGGR